MKKIIIISNFILMIFIFNSCGQDGDAIAPSSTPTGSTIQSVSASCNGQPCI